MTGLTVNELVDLLAKEIAAGNGNHRVLAVVFGDTILDDNARESLAARNWEVCDIDVPDHPGDTFISLGAWPKGQP